MIPRSKLTKVDVAGALHTNIACAELKCGAEAGRIASNQVRSVKLLVTRGTTCPTVFRNVATLHDDLRLDEFRIWKRRSFLARQLNEN